MVDSISFRYIYSQTRGYPYLEIRSILNISFKPPIRFVILSDGFDLSGSHGVQNILKDFLIVV